MSGPTWVLFRYETITYCSQVKVFLNGTPMFNNDHAQSGFILAYSHFLTLVASYTILNIGHYFNEKPENIPVGYVPPACLLYTCWPQLGVSSMGWVPIPSGSMSGGGYALPLDIPNHPPGHTHPSWTYPFLGHDHPLDIPIPLDIPTPVYTHPLDIPILDIPRGQTYTPPGHTYPQTYLRPWTYPSPGHIHPLDIPIPPKETWEQTYPPLENV